jgi:TnpA family transposase
VEFSKPCRFTLAATWGRWVRTSIIREHGAGIPRLLASRQAGTILLSAILNRHATCRRRKPLDLAWQTLGHMAARISRRMQREAGSGTYEPVG